MTVLPAVSTPPSGTITRVLIFVVLLLGMVSCAGQEKQSASGAMNVPKLPPPGPVYLITHGASEPGEDPPDVNLIICSEQRNLTDAGRAQARRIGAELRRRDVVPGPVFSSRYCRARETAMIAFGAAAPTPYATPRRYGSPQQRDEARQQFHAFLRQQIHPGHSLVVVTHSEVLKELLGVSVDGPGQAVVVPAEHLKEDVTLRMFLERASGFDVVNLVE